MRKDGTVEINGMLLWKPMGGNAIGTGTVMEMWMQTATAMWGQLAAETRLFGVSLTLGVWLMILYDILRVFRAVLPHGTLAVNLEDLVYFVYCGFQTFDLLYVYQNGTIRFYAVGAIGLGMILYERIVGRKLRNYLKKVCKSFRMKIGKLQGLHKR